MNSITFFAIGAIFLAIWITTTVVYAMYKEFVLNEMIIGNAPKFLTNLWTLLMGAGFIFLKFGVADWFFSQVIHPN